MASYTVGEAMRLFDLTEAQAERFIELMAAPASSWPEELQRRVASSDRLQARVVAQFVKDGEPAG